MTSRFYVGNEVHPFSLITRAERTNFQVKSLLIVGIDASD